MWLLFGVIQMKKHFNCLCLIVCLTLIIIFVFFVSCVYKNLIASKYFPTEQEKTEWATKDDTIHFYIDKANTAPFYGYLKTEAGKIDVRIDMGPLTHAVFVYLRDDEQRTNQLELWWIKKISKNSVTILVEQSSYFNVGDTFVIYRK